MVVVVVVMVVAEKEKREGESRERIVCESIVEKKNIQNLCTVRYRGFYSFINNVKNSMYHDMTGPKTIEYSVVISNGSRVI